MTALGQIKLSSPTCGNSFQFQAVVSTNAFGEKRMDFHECASETPVWMTVFATKSLTQRLNTGFCLLPSSKGPTRRGGLDSF